jgi:hypothetical protein
MRAGSGDGSTEEAAPSSATTSREDFLRRTHSFLHLQKNLTVACYIS